MTYLSYRGYTGSIEYSHDDGSFYGQVQGIKSLISYEGSTGPQLEKDFQKSIDAYLESCTESGELPEKSFKGSFNVRVTQELHEKAYWMAKANRESLNTFVSEAIRERVMKKS